VRRVQRCEIHSDLYEALKEIQRVEGCSFVQASALAAVLLNEKKKVKQSVESVEDFLEALRL